MNEAQKEAKRRAEVMLAFAEGKEIERDHYGIWVDSSDPKWNWSYFNYRIKPSAKRKIVLEAWLDQKGELRHCTEGSVSDPIYRNWTRLPGLDLETEIDE